MEQITIEKEKYVVLLKDHFFADSMRNLLSEKAKANSSIFADEVRLLCKLYGVEVEEE